MEQAVKTIRHLGARGFSIGKFRTIRHLFLRGVFFLLLVQKRKITARKIGTFATNYWCNLRKSLTSGTFPSVIIFEVTNRCNLHCKACRHTTKKLVDQSGSYSEPIDLGAMPFETFKGAIDEAGDHMLLALMYLAGEPLLNRDIFKMIEYANQKKVPTLMSSNGMLLRPDTCEKIMDAGLDFIMIAISGFTQEIYGREHRGGDIERIKQNLKTLAETKKRKKAHIFIMVDYIVFDHNEHEFDQMQAYCDELGIFLNRRSGRTNDQDGIEKSKVEVLQPNLGLCDWIWKTMSLNWDGRVFPCCEYGFWSTPDVMGVYKPGVSLKEMWNAPSYQDFRSTHINKGRSAIARCKDCHYKGIRFQG